MFSPFDSKPSVLFKKYNVFALEEERCTFKYSSLIILFWMEVVCFWLLVNLETISESSGEVNFPITAHLSSGDFLFDSICPCWLLLYRKKIASRRVLFPPLFSPTKMFRPLPGVPSGMANSISWDSPKYPLKFFTQNLGNLFCITD